MRSVPGGAHDGDDLFDLRRIGRVAQTFVARRVTSVESRHRRRRSTSTGAVEQKLGQDPSSGSWTNPTIDPSRRPGRSPALSLPARSSGHTGSASTIARASLRQRRGTAVTLIVVLLAVALCTLVVTVVFGGRRVASRAEPV
jgi:hypothetical protein